MVDILKDSKMLPSSSVAAVDRILSLRGAALQTLVALSERNSLATYFKRFAFQRLKSNAFGVQGLSGSSDDTSSLRFSQSQLRLLRQEQLMLMAENERLVYELQEIRRCRSTGQFRRSQPRAVPEFRESKLSKAIDLTLSGGRDSRLSGARIALLCALIGRLRYKVMGAVFRALSRQPLRSLRFSSTRLMGYGHSNIQQLTTPCMILENIVRSMVHRTERLTLRLLGASVIGKPTPLHYPIPHPDPLKVCGGLNQTESRPAGKCCLYVN
ncbi:uncharacterized protein BXIN_0769 [Babesia sp. Xinjiang]|uniref:uncharacterized protein n=1 Tax=Babesia sp. Xinjiang TaxID=462227 RepID=UPI000A2616BD|nr:uncharacterized protein BXIN_0769 [Babesia sp. Xinjiang]ORM41349.1 hypothetical protein BXIN_0769 [Babesia sp. Xinjiang]